MKIEKGKIVNLTYDLHLNGFEGELVESTKPENPLVFVYGDGNMLESFESKIKDLSKGDNFKFSLSKDEAYGDEIEDAIAEFPKDVFLQEEMTELPKVGEHVPMQDAEGNRFDGIVTEIKDSSVVVDFNHPLAGEDLYFTGKIIDVKDSK